LTIFNLFLTSSGAAQCENSTLFGGQFFLGYRSVLSIPYLPTIPNLPEDGAETNPAPPIYTGLDKAFERVEFVGGEAGHLRLLQRRGGDALYNLYASFLESILYILNRGCTTAQPKNLDAVRAYF
jgi:hypothetical protein